jgi:hypothetical protein
MTVTPTGEEEEESGAGLDCSCPVSSRARGGHSLSSSMAAAAAKCPREEGKLELLRGDGEFPFLLPLVINKMQYCITFRSTCDVV